MALVTISTMARCSASQSSAVASSLLSQSAKASRAVVRLDRALGSASCSGGTGSASHWAASAVMSSAVAGAGQHLHAQLADPLRRARVRVRAHSARARSGGPRRAGSRPRRPRPRRARPCPRRWSGPAARRGRRCTAGRASPGASAPLASTGGEPVPSGPVPVPSRYLALPVHADDQRRGMPAGGVAQRPRGRVEHHEHEGGGAQRRHPGGERVGPPQHLAEVVLGGEQFGQHGAELSHRGGGGYPVADHVPDDERDGAAVQRDRVEPSHRRPPAPARPPGSGPRS